MVAIALIIFMEETFPRLHQGLEMALKDKVIVYDVIVEYTLTLRSYTIECMRGEGSHVKSVRKP